MTTKTLLLGSHDQVPTLPQHAVYMVFVARHARHIILEHPEEDLGSLRHTVVKKLLNYGGMCPYQFSQHECNYCAECKVN